MKNTSFKFSHAMKATISLSIFSIILGFGLLLNPGCTNPKSVNKQENKIIEDERILNTLVDDGAWCWFSDPRAIYISEDEIVTGWVKKDGSVEVAQFDISTGKKQFNTLYPQMQKDDHNNPAFTVLQDGRILTMFTWHGGTKGVISNLSVNPYDLSTFTENMVFIPKTEDLLKLFPHESYTYANPYVLKGENNKLYSFGRWIGYKPNMIISEDNGVSWKEQYVIVSREPFDTGNRPYAKYFSDGQDKIHMLFTDGHPEVEPLNSVYYCYYKDNAFWRADGIMICKLEELPFEPEDASLVYQASKETGRAWIADIVEVEAEKPIILYTRHPEKTDHRYHYAWYNHETKLWVDHEICKAGKWFPQTPAGKRESESYYFGNLTIHPAKPNIVYLSRQVNDIFEIEKFTTNNGGASWDSTPITSNSPYDNVRPYVPRYMPDNAKTVVLWMENKKYIHYTDFDTSIKYFVDN